MHALHEALTQTHGAKLIKQSCVDALFCLDYAQAALGNFNPSVCLMTAVTLEETRPRRETG